MMASCGWGVGADAGVTVLDVFREDEAGVADELDGVVRDEEVATPITVPRRAAARNPPPIRLTNDPVSTRLNPTHVKSMAKPMTSSPKKDITIPIRAAHAPNFVAMVGAGLAAAV